MKLVYSRYPLNYSPERRLFCVYADNQADAEKALKDFDDIEFVTKSGIYHLEHDLTKMDYKAPAERFMLSPDVWIHSKKHWGSDSYYLGVLTALKNAGFEFSADVNRFYKEQTEKAGKESAETRPSFRYMAWCFKYDCPVENGCGNCKRRVYDCHPEYVKVEIKQ